VVVYTPNATLDNAVVNRWRRMAVMSYAFDAVVEEGSERSAGAITRGVDIRVPCRTISLDSLRSLQLVALRR